MPIMIAGFHMFIAWYKNWTLFMNLGISCDNQESTFDVEKKEQVQ